MSSAGLHSCLCMGYVEDAFASQKVILCVPKDVKLSELI
jgi:hypothetical protein